MSMANHIRMLAAPQNSVIRLSDWLQTWSNPLLATTDSRKITPQFCAYVNNNFFMTAVAAPQNSVIWLSDWLQTWSNPLLATTDSRKITPQFCAYVNNNFFMTAVAAPQNSVNHNSNEHD